MGILSEPSQNATTDLLQLTSVSDELEAEIRQVATRIRRRVLKMGEVQGQGYVGQGLGFADALAVVYGYAARSRTGQPEWDGRDRVLLSIGHYAIALYAALAEVGYVAEDDLETYGMDDSRLPMSGMASYTPGMEISGGSLGHGLGIGVGIGLAFRTQRKDNRIFALVSDGELNEGSTWEAAAAAAHHRLGNLVAVVDMNGLQADGPTRDVLGMGPVDAKWRAFGWDVHHVDGNNIRALLEAFSALPAADSDRPTVILCDTVVGKGVPFLESRERNHFMRIDQHEWALANIALAEGSQV